MSERNWSTYFEICSFSISRFTFCGQFCFALVIELLCDSTPCWWNTRDQKEAHLANTRGVVAPVVGLSSRKKIQVNNMVVQGEVGVSFCTPQQSPRQTRPPLVILFPLRSDTDLDPPWTLNSPVFTRIKRILTAHFEQFVLECYKENCLL